MLLSIQELLHTSNKGLSASSSSKTNVLTIPAVSHKPGINSNKQSLNLALWIYLSTQCATRPCSYLDFSFFSMKAGEVLKFQTVLKVDLNFRFFRGGGRTAATSKMELETVNYYHKALHLGYCSSPRSTSVLLLKTDSILLVFMPLKPPLIPRNKKS